MNLRRRSWTLPNPREVGVTRFADTTGLDRLGIPTFSCVIPGTTDSIWVYSGKGTTRKAARLGALLEGIERTSALWPHCGVRVCSEMELQKNYEPYIRPAQFTEKLERWYNPRRRTAWVEAVHISDMTRTLVPADLVFIGKRPSCMPSSAFVCSTSNGLGCAFTRDDAIRHGILELIERHVVSCVDVWSGHEDWAMLRSMGSSISLDPERLAAIFIDSDAHASDVPTRWLSPGTKGLIRRFDAANVAISIKQLRSPNGIFVVGAASLEHISSDELLSCAGYAADLTLDAAARRAILELAQSRATDLQGAREDCGVHEKARWRVDRNHWLFSTTGSQSMDLECPTPVHCVGAQGAIEQCVRVLSQEGLPEVLVVDLKAPQGLSVVRVLCPGIETWHATAGDSRRGVVLGGPDI